MNKSEVVNILGINIGRSTLDELVLQAHNAMLQQSPQITFACANPHSIVLSQSDTEFYQNLNDNDQIVVDGVGLSLFSKYAGIDVGQRITGHDYFLSVMNYLKLRGQGKVFFFGSSNTVLKEIEKRYHKEYPMLDYDSYSPPFRDWSDTENEKMLEVINDAKPDVIWVGMTAPKQEKWVANNRDKLNVPVIASIGAVFDFYAGTYPRAPKLMSHLGFEWLYRLYKEPKRMWKRNFVSTPLFIYHYFKKHILSENSNYSVYTNVPTHSSELQSEDILEEEQVEPRKFIHS